MAYLDSEWCHEIRWAEPFSVPRKHLVGIVLVRASEFRLEYQSHAALTTAATKASIAIARNVLLCESGFAFFFSCFAILSQLVHFPPPYEGGGRGRLGKVPMRTAPPLDPPS